MEQVEEVGLGGRVGTSQTGDKTGMMLGDKTGMVFILANFSLKGFQVSTLMSAMARRGWAALVFYQHSLIFYQHAHCNEY